MSVADERGDRKLMETISNEDTGKLSGGLPSPQDTRSSFYDILSISVAFQELI